MNRIEKAKDKMKQLNLEDNSLSAAFPEFKEVKNRFIYGEIFQMEGLSDKRKMLVATAALATVEGEELKEQMAAALKTGVSPLELQEVFHQAAPYIGFAKAEKGLKVLKNVLEEAEISLPLKKQGAVTEEDRLEKGIAVQKKIFGPMIDMMRSSAPENQKFMQDYLSAYCFGDTYTRGALDLPTRELLTFVCVISLGGCESQAKSHAGGNMMIGNGPDILLAAVAQCLPYIGFPRALNAITAINEILKMNPVEGSK